ncbi:MAG: conjugal transfer protein TraF [Gammaproteobacteria bacterium]|nr:conjugal transfer protein TraF [Gammaproteobacteria bacterium]MDH5727541.1 conjugal transfer protein TraF [Gammaproteobacteria bacterium]
MKKLFSSLLLTALWSGVSAGPVFHPMGASMTYGDVSVTQNIFASTNNPSSGASVFEYDRTGEFRFGLVSSIGASLELAQIDAFIDDINDMQDNLNLQNVSIAQVTDMKNRFDNLLVKLGDEPYLFNIGLAAEIPLFPIVFSGSSIGGALTLDVNTAVQLQAGLLDSPFQFNPETQQPETNTAFYIKGGNVTETSATYSRQLFTNFMGLGLGNLYAGVDFNLYQVGLKKLVLGMAKADALNAIVQSELSGGFTQVKSFGLDAGVLLVNKNYRVGATINNINSPSYAYPSVGTDCETIDDLDLKDSCFIARAYASEIALEELHVMNPQLRVEGSFTTKSKNFVISGLLDVNYVHDLLGNPTQRFSVSAAYASRSWIIPGLRVGYHQNLVGTQLGYVALGMSLFKSVHADVALSPQMIEYQGSQLPRKIALNIGFDLNF